METTMLRIPLSIVFAASATLLSVSSASAWNQRGHTMAAAVAWEQLKPATRSKSITLLTRNPKYKSWVKGVAKSQRGKIAFVKASVWADDIKGDPIYTDEGDDVSGPGAARNIGYK